MKSKFLLSALTLLGFSGCSDQGNLFGIGDVYTEPDMYGVPLVDYHFMGELTDAEGNPIKGIEVKVSSSSQSTLSDAQGAFSAEFTSEVGDYHTVTFTDIDGTENGGYFTKKMVETTSDESQEAVRTVFDLGTIVLEPEEEE